MSILECVTRTTATFQLIDRDARGENLLGKDFNSVLYQEEECPVTVWHFL